MAKYKADIKGSRPISELGFDNRFYIEEKDVKRIQANAGGSMRLHSQELAQFSDY